MRRKLPKYQNQKISYDGYSFASKLEAAVYQVLKYRQAAKEIRILQVQDHVYLTRADVLYVPDFKCLDCVTKEEFWVEAKGFAAPTWPIKKRLWKHYGPGRLEIWKGLHGNPFLQETIIPKTGGGK